MFYRLPETNYSKARYLDVFRVVEKALMYLKGNRRTARNISYDIRRVRGVRGEITGIRLFIFKRYPKYVFE